jgi:branched-chain amino acid transport system substrate-binding protein
MRHAFSLLLAIALVGGCKSKPANEIVVGEYAAMSGAQATFGQSSHKGSVMAVEEINAAGGALGKKFRLVTEDDQSKPEDARTAALKLIQQDNAVALVGEIASSNSKAAAPAAQEAQIPMISPGSTNPDVTAIGDYIFRVCFIDPFQGAVMAKFATETLKAKKVALLVDVKSDYSVGLAKFFEEALTRAGGQIVIRQDYSAGDIEFSAQLTAIKSKNPDAIFLPGYYTEAGLVMKKARELGITVPFLGGDGWDSPKTTEIGGAAAEGSYFSNHYSAENTDPTVQTFVKNFEAKYHEEPDAMAALGYDSIKLLADAIRRAGTTDHEKLRQALAETKDLPSVTGKTTINAQRNPEKAAVVLVIKGGKFKYHSTVQP